MFRIGMHYLVGSGSRLRFGDQTSLMRAVDVESNTVLLSSAIPRRSSIVIIGGTYSKNYGRFTSSNGTVNPGDTVQLKATTSAGYSTAVNVTVIIGSLISVWTLTTTAQLFDAISGGVAGWSSQAQLKASFVTAAMTQAAGAVTSVKDQVGARDWTCTGSPAVGSGSIGANAFMGPFDGVDDKFSFTVLSLGTADWTAIVVAGADTLDHLGTLLGLSSGTCSLRGVTASTGFDLRSTSAGPTAYNTQFGLNPGMHTWMFTRTGTTLTIYQNAEAMGNPVGRTIAGAFSFDQLLVSSAATARSQAGLCMVGVWTRLLTAAEIELATAIAKNEYPHACFVDQTAGNDSNRGWTTAVPLKTVSGFRTKIWRRGQNIRLKRGEVWRRDPLLFNTTNQGGAVGDPIVVSDYGDPSLRKPLNLGSEAAAGPWVPTVGNTYSTVFAGLASIQMVWAVDEATRTTFESWPGVNVDIPTVIPLAIGTGAATLTANQYFQVGTTLYVDLGGTNPTTLSIEVAHNGNTFPDVNGDTIRPAKAYMKFKNIEARFSYGDTVRHEAGSDLIEAVDSYWAGSDAFGGGGLSLIEKDCVGYMPGAGRVSSGPAGDFASLHGNATALRYRCVGIRAGKAGIDDVDDVVASSYGCYVRGCNRNIFTANPDAGVTGGLKSFAYLTVVHESDDNVYAVENSSNQNMAMNHATIVNTGAVGATIAIRQNTTGTTAVTNTLASGFATRLIKDGAGTLTADYNLADTGESYGAGASAGAHDLTADPVFVNGGAKDYHLNTGSPGIGAANDSGDIGALSGLTG